LDEKQKIYWNPMNTRKFSLMSILRLILKLLDVGSQIMVGSILLLVLVVQLPVVVLICLLLMILTVSKMRYLLISLILITSGILLALGSVCSLTAQLC
jgi:hypothetical protein